MGFLLKTLSAVIGAAFLFAVANLVVSGVPVNMSAQLASATPAPAPGSLRDTVAPLLGEASSQVPAVIAPQATPTAFASEIEADWRAWMAANALTAGAMVVLFPDGAMHRAGLDRVAETSVPVASLSKAITGTCLDIALQEQGLSWYTTLGDITPQMSALRVTPQPWNARITLASLANHTSGLAPDLTQGAMGSTLHGALGLHRRIASEALQEGNIRGATREYFYSNTNYAVLGVVIEALTGQSYSEACLDRVVTPAGITDATIHGAMGSRSSYGGWEMSAASYARLAQHWFSADNPAIDRPFDRPMHDNYSLGYVIHGRGADAQTSHAGQFCYPTGINTGAYFHARGDGTVFVANWSGPCVSATDTGLGATIAERMR